MFTAIRRKISRDLTKQWEPASTSCSAADSSFGYARAVIEIFPVPVCSGRGGEGGRRRRTYHYGATPFSTIGSERSSGRSIKDSGGKDNTVASCAYDFRSDTVTTPTPSMLAALTSGVHKYDDNTITSAPSSPSSFAATSSTSSLVFGDDVYSEDASTIALERRIARLTGHEAGLLVISGTMANQIAVRTHLSLDRRRKGSTRSRPGTEDGRSTPPLTGTDTSSTVRTEDIANTAWGRGRGRGRSEGSSVRGPPYSILCDARAHILNYEAGGAAALSGAMVDGVMPRNGRHLTLEDDVLPHATVSELKDDNGDDDENHSNVDIHAAPTAVVVLENTLKGMIFPLEEMRRIADWTRRQGVALHLDGARLWEAAAAAAVPDADAPGTGAGTYARGSVYDDVDDSKSSVSNSALNNQNSHDSTDPTLRTLHSYACIPDSASLCLSKGLCAPIGTVLVGSERFIRHARRVRKMFGGGVRIAGLVAVPARVALEEVFIGGVSAQGRTVSRRLNEDQDQNQIQTRTYAGSTLRKTHATVRRLADYWAGLCRRRRGTTGSGVTEGEEEGADDGKGSSDPAATTATATATATATRTGSETSSGTGTKSFLKFPPQTNQLWLDLAAAGVSERRMQRCMLDAGLKGGSRGRLVVHAQICDDAVRRLEGVFRRCFDDDDDDGDDGDDGDDHDRDKIKY